QRSHEATKQRSKENFIIGEQAVPFVKKGEPKHVKRAIVARANDIPKNWKLKIFGEHNRYNAACALAVADALRVPRAVSKKVIEGFRGVPGRLEFVREMRGVKIYNDTTATTPEATTAALRALGETTKQRSKKAKKQKSKKATKQNIILIAGGADKGLDMSELAKEIPKWCKAVVLLVGTGTDKFSNNFKIQNSKFKIGEATTLKKALSQAIQCAQKGDIVLFSPAFASFGMFKNEYDRGEQFNRLIRRLN
ncbi:MAG: hypothetical protein HYS73_00695, partial [Parcubacteria group bacterium]|nr:hypothetical protein [Parcubacteria group bacterium]